MNNRAVVFLALLVLVMGFLVTDRSFTGSSVALSTVDVENLQCEERDGIYEVCADVSWDSVAGAYAKAVLAGADNIQTAEKHSEPSFHYCTRAERLGNYGFNVYIFTEDNKLVHKQLDSKVRCEKAFTPGADFRDYVYFVAYGDAPESRGRGEVTVDIPREPESCEFIGEYETKGAARGSGRDDDETGYYCTGATGNFWGYADQFAQLGKEDADFFNWFGYEQQGKLNPPEHGYEGYILQMRLCDTRYLEERDFANHKNYVTMKVTDFGKQLRLAWVYRNSGARPQLLVKMHVLCKMKQQPATSMEPVEEKPLPLEEIAENIELDLEDAEPLEAETEEPFVEAPAQLSWFARVKKTVVGFFQS